ncbi:MAG: hypothetical protein AAGD25_10865 [Cyanobacteria bacterium P01_F01_bin.150]
MLCLYLLQISLDQDGDGGGYFCPAAHGDDTLIGGVCSNIFVLRKGYGTDLIRDFNIGEDLVRLQGSLSQRTHQAIWAAFY